MKRKVEWGCKSLLTLSFCFRPANQNNFFSWPLLFVMNNGLRNNYFFFLSHNVTSKMTMRNNTPIDFELTTNQGIGLVTKSGCLLVKRNIPTLSATDVLAPTTMKNAAKCDTSCELQNPVSHQNFERNLHLPWEVCLLECLFIPIKEEFLLWSRPFELFAFSV